MPEAASTEKRAANKKDWAAWIDWMLKELRWTQCQLAKHCGVSEATVSRWRSPDPRLGTLPSGSACKLLYQLARERNLCDMSDR